MSFPWTDWDDQKNRFAEPGVPTTRHPIFVIHLLERKDRLQSFEEDWNDFPLLKENRVEFILFPAQKHGSDVIFSDTTKKFKNGCTASHASIMHFCTTNQIQLWTVLEDDAYATDKRKLSQLLLNVLVNPSIVKEQGLIQWGPSTLRNSKNELALEVIPYNCDFFVSHSSLATHALTMHHSQAHAALQKVKEFSQEPIDNILFYRVARPFAVPQAVPIVLQAAGYSDIEKANVNYARNWASVLKDRKTFQNEYKEEIEAIDINLDPCTNQLYVQNGSLSFVLSQLQEYLEVKPIDPAVQLQMIGVSNTNHKEFFRDVDLKLSYVIHSIKKKTVKTAWDLLKNTPKSELLHFITNHIQVPKEEKSIFIHIQGGSLVHDWKLAQTSFQGCNVILQNILTQLKQWPTGTLCNVVTDDVLFCIKQLRLAHYLEQAGYPVKMRESKSEAEDLSAMLSCTLGGIPSQSELSGWAILLGKVLWPKLD